MKKLLNRKIIYVIACIMLACVVFSACAKIKITIEDDQKNNTPAPAPASSSAIPEEETVTIVPVASAEATLCPSETPNPTEKPLLPTAIPVSSEPVETTAPTQSIIQTVAPVETQKVSVTQKVTPKTTPSPTPNVTPNITPNTTPNTTQKSESSVRIVIVTPTPVIYKTHIVSTPAPSAAPAGGISQDKCSMTDYTKQALPSEQYKNEITAILSKAATGNGTTFSQNTSVDITAFLYSHRYLLGTIRLTLIGYRNPASYTITSSFKYAESKDQYLETLAWGDQVISKLGINKNTLQRDAITKINRYLADYLTYDYEAYDKYLAGEGYNVDENAYISIKTGIGVCEHYAQLFQLLCHKCGISAYYEANSTRFHAYNYVLFSDGTKYYVDATWNDSIETTKFNINGVQYKDVYAAADGIWEGLPDNTYKRFSSGLHCDKQGFVEYYCEFYLSRYLLLSRSQFISIHTPWSADDHYYNYEVHED